MNRLIFRGSVVLAAGAASVAVATAAAAVLPGAASDTAREHTAEVTVPGPNAAAGTHPSGTAPEAVEHKSAKPAEQATEESEDTHGATVSGLATSTTLTGAEKGAAIAAVASEGRSTARGESAERSSEGRAKAADASDKGAESSAAGRAKAESKRP